MRASRLLLRFAVILPGSLWLALGCDRPTPPPEPAQAAPEPAPAVAEPAAATATAAPPEAASPTDAPAAASPSTADWAPAKTVVQMSDLPSDATSLVVIAGYDKAKKNRPLEPLELNTDRNAVEFPQSKTAVKLVSVPVAKGEGVGEGRALGLDFVMPDQTTPYAPCMGKGSCGCHKITPYAYINVLHALPKETRLAEWQDLSFWLRSKEPFGLHLVLSCFIEPRHMSNVAPFNGYLDEALTEMDPCWQPRRVELNLSDPVAIVGDDRWHRYAVRVAGLPPGQPVTMTDGSLKACTLAEVTHVGFVIKRSRPPLPAEYPHDAGLVLLDEVQLTR